MLTSLSNFPTIQEVSALRNMDPGEVEAMVFYKHMILRWGWTRHLEETIRIETGRLSWIRIPSTLKMAGVSSALYGQEMSVKPDLHRDLGQFLYERDRPRVALATHYIARFIDKCLT